MNINGIYQVQVNDSVREIQLTTAQRSDHPTPPNLVPEPAGHAPS